MKIRKLTILAASLIILITVILNILSAEVPFKDWVTFYIILICVGRTRETFFTGKVKKFITFKEDWTLPLLTLAYILMLLGSILEFFILKRDINLYVAISALFFQFVGFRLRWRGMKSLGDQWTTFIIPITRLKNRKTTVIKKGPYRYLRHPIYLGVVLDVLAIPLVLNSYYTFFFALFINFPLQLLRVKLEEKKLIEFFGYEYRDYKREVRGFIPIKKGDYNATK